MLILDARRERRAIPELDPVTCRRATDFAALNFAGRVKAPASWELIERRRLHRIPTVPLSDLTKVLQVRFAPLYAAIIKRHGPPPHEGK